MKKFAKASLALTAAAITAGTIAPASVLAWGDNSKDGRPSYTVADINAGKLGNTITFNSISDSVLGNEKNFVAAYEKDSNASTWNADEITVKDGKEYVVRLYVHNNNPNGEKAVAKDVTTYFGIPTTSGKSLQVSGYITSSNATPTKYWDSVVFKSDHSFHLEYQPGSALWQNNKVGANGGIQLSDNVITTKGTKIGYTALDGNIPGCYTYDGLVTIRVKAVYDYEYTTETKVRREGAEKWEESVDAKPGEIVEYAIKYTNTSDASQQNVIVKDVLAKGMEYVKDSTYLYNSNHPKGLLMTDNTITTTGINIGNYASKGFGYVTFKAKVVEKDLNCGESKLGNWGQVSVKNTTRQDSASVFTSRTCADQPTDPAKPTPQPEKTDKMPQTGAAGTITGIVGLGTVISTGAYYIASRKKLAARK